MANSKSNLCIQGPHSNSSFKFPVLSFFFSVSYTANLPCADRSDLQLFHM